MNYDSIYQCTLEQYAIWHNTTIPELVNKVVKDIELMQIGKDTIFVRAETDERGLTMDEVNIVREINNAIKKKTKHLQRLKEWKTSHMEADGKAS